jgi:hypothetical protein
MVKGIVEKTMFSALKRFAEKEEESAKNIQLFIHTKNEELLPEYFYAVKGKVVQEEGETLKLSFLKDILGRKMDLTGKEALSNQFLSNYFKTVSKEINESPKKLYIMITAKSEQDRDLHLGLYVNNNLLRGLELGEIFGED